MLKILQARLQQYVNHELLDVQTGFRKGRGTRDQIDNICCIIGKSKRVPEKHLFLSITLSITNSQSLLKLTSMVSVMSFNHLILCCPLLLLPSVFPSIRVFSNESVLHIRWPEYWSFSFSISPSNEYSGLIFLGLTCLISLLTKELSRVFSNTTIQKHQFFSAQLSLWSNSHIHTWLLEKP